MTARQRAAAEFVAEFEALVLVFGRCARAGGAPAVPRVPSYGVLAA